MARFVPVSVVLVAALALFFVMAPQRVAATNGGCIACTLLTSTMTQLSQRDNVTVNKWIVKACNLFPNKFVSICQYFVNEYGAEIIKLLEQGFTADEVCLGVHLCSNASCALFPKSGMDVEVARKRLGVKDRSSSPSLPSELSALLAQLVGANIADFEAEANKHWNSTPWDWLLKLLAPLLQKSEPVEDLDNDLFSDLPTLRGSDWRGKDCNDLDKNAYPGRKDQFGTPNVDHNCNGIYTVNGTDYEKLFCQNSGQIGLIVVGDSASAHFSIPPEWINATLIKKGVYDNLLEALSNELDWPHRSTITGFEPDSPEIPIQSMYKYMAQRNPCNHRDFQNLARNGLSSRSVMDLATTIHRDQKLDQPALLFYSLIGNDVCSTHPGNASFTTTDEFLNSTLTALNYLDTKLPAGSHVVLTGLANGSVLWDYLHDRIHPVGLVTYAQVYSWLICLESNPCTTWMNADPVARAQGDERALELSAIYPQIMQNYKFNNFDMEYYPFPFQQIVEDWESQGGEAWQLIEAVDGFHPNQIADALIAEFYWQRLQQDHPDWLGPVNPYAANITRIFGNQGGY